MLRGEGEKSLVSLQESPLSTQRRSREVGEGPGGEVRELRAIPGRHPLRLHF
jgi:hypothetical protein